MGQKVRKICKFWGKHVAMAMSKCSQPPPPQKKGKNQIYFENNQNTGYINVQSHVSSTLTCGFLKLCGNAKFGDFVVELIHEIVNTKSEV